MKVLLCSPYLDDPRIVSGGINMWARHVISYHKTIKSDMELIPVSFDRRVQISENTPFLRRIYYGIIDLFTSAKKAVNIMKSDQVNIVHICTSASFSLSKDIFLLKAARKRGVKSVVHFHFGRIPQIIEAKTWEWHLLKHAISLADTVITMDKQSYNSLNKYGYANVKYCPNPLSLSIKKIISESEFTGRIPRKLIFVGHLYASKGIYELVEACGRICNIQLHVFGCGPKEVEEHLRMIASKGAEADWLYLHGEVPHKQIIKELLSSDMFVLPSYTEGFPNVILEAMACGCPIIATNVGAIPEMLDVENNPCGICVQSRGVDEIYNAIKLLLSDEEMKRLLAERAQKRVNELYSMPRVWDSLFGIWNETTSQ